MSVRQSLFGVELDPLTLDETVERCLEAVRDGKKLEIGVVNAAKLVNMRRDQRLARAVAGCDLVLADGQAVVWAGRVLRAPLPERVAGIDLFLRLLGEAESAGMSVYFLGAKQEVLQRMLLRVADRFPDLKVAGSRNGYFDDSEQEAIADGIARSGARMLFLGMTSPKKEIFTAAHGERTGARVVHGVGGSFDILAGVTKRAPEVWQRWGMEWLYRALQEPRRLGRRYVTTNAAFLLMTAREYFRPAPSPAPANRSR
ncbi:N-acetylglucosaminyldiphosphoundecaprenol N-acetyl-beta-D-mannosaminyltransferase [Streptomyces sp. 1222.5]|uniref:WecB/TagA/CpsF family glycosyltransferase n=1 Tax=unclassified Streptomyces TaxID=2593676 RepID=UPI000894C0ED|nr:MULTISPECIES: WecB/TagA/CpsF family glycosyltransferase [unclassified Streptomyces]PKW12122.1 N-acetylglucosaminyldiphosphoundecaprenol N-acetyl-beta-D-mannosaminyltransferase [Streptomyces sp. 5112.2]SEB62253.1 N-acetylglucosaminyldiphosphoundecaprenol N-acetyl-beta-D-mannosaminyltransferase [Streptomyces sp. 1222.5]